MFGQVWADFDARIREVDLYFQMLVAIDNDGLTVVGQHGGGWQAGPLPKGVDSMLKGAAYLVLYNLVEAFVRRGFQAVFESISADALCGVDLTDKLREQWVMQRQRRVQAFDASPKVYLEITTKIIDELSKRETAELNRNYLPMSGNLDGDGIRELCIRHGVDHRTSPASRGGDALKLVRNKRNSLAHGDESFSESGRHATATDLLASKGEAVQFIRDILTNLEAFVANKAYRTVAGPP